MSASDDRVIFGLGGRGTIESLRIEWPSGHVDVLKSLPIDKIIAVKEAVGVVPMAFPKIPEQDR
jgi:hypothetical protein